MDKKEEFMILLAEQLVKYKGKYKKIQSEYDKLKYNSEKLPNIEEQEEKNLKINFGDLAKDIFIKKHSENIHPKIKQTSEDNKVVFKTNDEMSETAVSNALDEKKFEKQLLDTEHIFDKNNYIKQGRDTDLRNDATDFINKNFFASDDKFYNFLFNFYNVMSLALSSYLNKIRPYLKTTYSLPDDYNINDNIKLIFKGGNILKAVFLKYKYETAGIVADKLNELFNKYFSRSDLDYQIIIYPNFTTDANTNKTIYDYLVDKISILVYWVMDEFRQNYIYKLDEIFDFYQLNNTCKILKLKKLKDKFNLTLENMQTAENFKKFIDTYGKSYNYYENMKIKNLFFNDICSDKNELDDYIKNIRENFVENDIVKDVLNNQEYFYNYRNDIYVKDKICDDDKKLSVKTINSSIPDFKCEHYITFIKNIYSEEKITKLIRSFSLIRTKINFFAEFTTGKMGEKYGGINIPGELIDLSISRFEDNRMEKFKTKKIQDMYTEYNFDYSDTKYKFYSYNLEFLMIDLFEVIYVDNVLPWNDVKYEKRLYRLFFFSIIDLLSLKNDEKQLPDLIAKLNEIISESIDNIISNDKYFKDKFSSITEPKIKKLMLLKLFNLHEEIIKKTGSSDEDKLKYYYQIIQKLLQEIKPILDSINKFCGEKYLGKINIEDDNFKNIHQMGGNTHTKKYLKYKKKYLLTKMLIDNKYVN